MTFLEWILSTVLLVIYFTCIFTVAGVTFRNEHTILGILGIFFPIFWLIGDPSADEESTAQGMTKGPWGESVDRTSPK
jgi:hypothetical protein